MEKIFMVFWLTGNYNIITGEDFESAFSKSWSQGAIPAVDFYSNGYEVDYFFNKNERSWNKKNATLKLPSLYEMSVENIARELQTNSSVEFQVPDSKDVICITLKTGSYYGVSEVVYWEVMYGEYFYDELTEGSAFMVTKPEYFASGDKDSAIAAFIDRSKNVENQLKTDHQGSSNFETIVNQPIVI